MLKNFQILRQSKIGNMNRKQISVIATATIFTVGVVSLCTVFSKGNKDNYKYDETLSESYANQLESRLDVDLDSDLEKSINKLQNISVLVNEYQDNEGFLQKSHISDSLVQNYSEIERTSLGILKRVVAREHGGDADDYRIGYEKSDNSWIASNQEVAAITLTGEERSLASSIGQFQNYKDIDFEKLDIDQMTKYINICSQVLDDCVSLATSKSEKSQNIKKP